MAALRADLDLRRGKVRSEPPSVLWRHEGVADAFRPHRMPSQPRQDELRLDVEVAEIGVQSREIRPGQAVLPDQDGAAPAQLGGIDPRTELELTVDDNVRMVRRIDRDVIR